MATTVGKQEQHPPGFVDFFKEVYQIWLYERPSQLAAALAYFGLFSFAPVMYTALRIAGLLINQTEALERFLARVETTLGPGVSQAVQGMLDRVAAGPQGSFLVSLISFFLVLLSASTVFIQLQFALNTLWKVPTLKINVMRRTVQERFMSFVIVISLGVLLVFGAAASFVSSWIRSIFDLPESLPTLTFLGFVTVATLSFGAMYKLLPATRIAWRDVWAGAATSACLIAIETGLVSFLIEKFSLASALGTAGSFVVLLTAFYYFAQIFLLGALLTRVYALRYGSLRHQAGSEPNADGLLT